MSETSTRGASLDGPWAFWPDLEGRLPTEPGDAFVPTGTRETTLGPARSARVPAPWQAQFDDLRMWAGTAWYERDLPLPEQGRDRRVRLTFGAIDYFATVWVNGRLAGEHEGGYLPFSLEVTDLVRYGHPNTVTVRVLDVGPGDEACPCPFAEVPHGKQSWYGPIGGLWQSAWIEDRGRLFVERIRIEADPFTGQVTAGVQLDGTPDERDEVRWKIVGPGGGIVATGDADVSAPLIHTHIPDVLAWDIHAPHLYRFEIDVLDAGVSIDHREELFGFRTVGVSDGRVTINGSPVYLLGALDQDYWLPDITTPADNAQLDLQMRRAKELGLNLLRCHIKPPDPRYLDAADRAGLLVWCEPPSWIRLTPAAKRRVRDTLAGMIDRDTNHPSLVIRSIVNEDWGTELATNSEHREWLRETYRWTKAADPSRLVVDNSACPPNFHVESDLNDFHVYRAVPEQASSWRTWTAEWVQAPDMTYSPHGDATVHGSEPLVVSEFGIWGLPHPDELFDDVGRAPWWFDTGQDFGQGVVHPAGVRERFDAWGLEGVFGSFEAFVRVSQDHEFEGLKLQIEDLRLHRQIAGYVITELTDVHWEANGLLDMGRRPKSFHERFDTVNAPNVAVVTTDRRRYRSGEDVNADVLLVGPGGREAGRIEWQLEGFDIGGEAGLEGRLLLTVPPVDLPCRATLRVRWSDPTGRMINHNSSPLWFSPASEPSAHPQVVVSSRWRDVADSVAVGGRAVIVVEDEGALPAGASVEAQPIGSDGDASSQSIYGDGWLMSTGMGWLSPALCDGLAIGPAVDLIFEGITPSFVLSGFGPDARTDVFAGHYLGWLHRNRATIAGFSHGLGAGIVCTFPLLKERNDPLATQMLDRLTAIAAATDFAPRTAI